MYEILSKFLKLDVRYFTKGGFWIVINLLLTTLTGLILSSLFSRLWPRDVFGQYSFYISFLTIISLTALPGMTSIVLQASSEKKFGVYKEAFKLIIKWSLLGGLATIAGGVYFYLRGNFDLAIIFLLSAPAFPLSATGALFSSYLIGKKEISKSSILFIISQLFSNLLTILALWKIPSLVVVALVSTWSTALINITLNMLLLRNLPNQTKDKKLLNLGIHLSLSQVFAIISDNFDKFLIPLLLGYSNNAIYAFAILIPTQIHNFLKSFIVLGQPKVAEIKDKDVQKSFLQKGFMMEFVVILIVVLYIFTSPTIFKILYPNYLDETVKLSQFFALGLLFYPSNLINLNFMKQRNHQAFYKINSIYLLFSVISSLALIPIWGVTGAIFAKILTKLIYSLTQIYLFWRSR